MKLLREEETTCRLCFGPATWSKLGDGFLTNCPRCTEFYISGSFLNSGFEKLSPTEKGILSIRAKRIEISDTTEPLVINFTNYRDLIDTYQQPEAATRRRMVLQYFAKQSRDVGDVVKAPDTYPSFECTSPRALEWLIRSLVDSGDLAQSPPGAEGFVVTAKGWDAVGAGRAIAGTCFIAMAFSTEMEPAHGAIDRAIRAVQLVPLRVDKVEHNKNINDFILAEIRNAEVVIAEFSQHNAGVYFEAGFALGLGREVIYLCREPDFAGSHFDTRAYNHIVWRDEPELEARLIARLRTTVPSLIASSGQR